MESYSIEPESKYSDHSMEKGYDCGDRKQLKRLYRHNNLIRVLLGSVDPVLFLKTPA